MAFTLETLKSLKRNSFSKNLIESVAKDFSTYEEAFRELCQTTHLVDSKDINFMMEKHLVENPFATCHALFENDEDTSFLNDLYEKEYGDFIFAMKINHVRKLLCLQIINSNVPKDFSLKSDGDEISTSYAKLVEYLETNSSRRDMFSSAHEIVDFGFIKCAMVLDHSYGIQDVVSVVFRILRKKYGSELEKRLQEATFAIPLDQAKYGIVACTSDFNSFRLNGVLLDISGQRDIADIVDAVEIYKHTQYDYRMKIEETVEAPSPYYQLSTISM